MPSETFMVRNTPPPGMRPMEAVAQTLSPAAAQPQVQAPQTEWASLFKPSTPGMGGMGG